MYSFVTNVVGIEPQNLKCAFKVRWLILVKKKKRQTKHLFCDVMEHRHKQNQSINKYILQPQFPLYV